MRNSLVFALFLGACGSAQVCDPQNSDSQCCESHSDCSANEICSKNECKILFGGRNAAFVDGSAMSPCLQWHLDPLQAPVEWRKNPWCISGWEHAERCGEVSWGYLCRTKPELLGTELSQQSVAILEI